MLRRSQPWLAALACIFLLSCEKPGVESPPSLVLKPTSFSALAGWGAADFSETVSSFLKSCDRLSKKSPSDPLASDPRFGTVSDWRTVCEGAAKLGEAADPAASRAFFETSFQVYRLSDSHDGEAFITGYYETSLDGSHIKTDAAQIPLYAPPAGMVRISLSAFDPALSDRTLVGMIDGNTVIPMPTRAEIEAGALADRGLEFLWVTDATDAFFLHIQGSGRVRLADGSHVRVGYAGKNGHPYFAIGRELIRRGALDRQSVSMQSIRAWLDANPEHASAVMNLNASFVFFRLLEEDGPIGSQGVVLTPERSLAVDPAFIPLGVPIWLDTVHPLQRDQPVRALVVAQDTGGAIKGPLRADLYWGGTDAAAAAAGEMKESGVLYVLLPAKHRSGDCDVTPTAC